MRSWPDSRIRVFLIAAVRTDRWTCRSTQRTVAGICAGSILTATTGRSISASVFVQDHQALGHIENATKGQHPTKEKKAMTTQLKHSGADELEVQRRDICAPHASQAQQ